MDREFVKPVFRLGISSLVVVIPKNIVEIMELEEKDKVHVIIKKVKK